MKIIIIVLSLIFGYVLYYWLLKALASIARKNEQQAKLYKDVNRIVNTIATAWEVPDTTPKFHVVKGEKNNGNENKDPTG